MNMKYGIIKSLSAVVVILTFQAIACFGQSDVMSAGQSVSGTTGSVSYSVGQANYIHISGESGKVNQGVQQPNLTFTVATEDPGLENIATLFPNPANESLYLKLDNQSSLQMDHFEYQLLDIKGELIKKQSIIDPLTNIQVAELTSGTYLLRVYKNSEHQQSFKLIKTN